MPTDHILALLIADRDKLNRAIDALQGPVKRRGRPPRNPLATAAAGQVAPTGAAATKKRKGLSAAARKAQSQRMKAYWAAKRKNRTR
jgi:hypothetical protein